MAKDFKASQVRTSQIIASSSLSTSPSLMILSASSAGVDFNGSVTVPAAVGRDVFVYVSGSTNSFGTTTRGVTLFGGDIVISGTAYNSAGNAYGNVAGSDKQVQFNDAGVFGASTGLTYDKNTQTLSVGNLVVTGTTTTVTSSNLVISDQVIYFGSGSKVSDTNGGIALASGSSIANQSLVFGRVASDTWGAGRQDVNSGTQTDLTGMTLVSLRASNFQIGGSSAVLSSSDGSNIIMYSGGASLINIAPGTGGLKMGSSTAPVGVTGSNVRIGNRSVEFSNELPPLPGNDTYFFVSGSLNSRGTSTRGVSVFGGDLVVSGNISGSTFDVTNVYVENLYVSGNTRLGNASSDSVQVTANSWFDNTLRVSGSVVLGNTSANSVTSNAKVWALSDLSVSGNLRVGDASTDSLQVTANSWFDNDLNVSGNLRVGDASTDSLQVTSNAWFDNTLRVSGSVVLGNTLANSVTSNAKVWALSDLNVSGNMRVGDASSDSLQVTANSWFDNNLNLSGSSILGNTSTNSVTANAKIWALSDLNVSGNVRIGDASTDSLRVTANSWFDNSLNVSGSVIVAGNLEVRGMITGSVLAITSTNLTISDQVIYLASGSKISNTDGGIAIASGSSITNQSLVFGRVGTDTWGAGRQDVNSGTVTDLTTMTLVPLRASKFEIGGSSLFVSSTNNGNSLLIRNSNPVSDISIFAGSTYGTATSAKMALTASAVKIGSVVGQPELPDIGADTFLYVSGSGGTKDSSTRGVSVFGGDVVISGTLYGGSPLKVSGGLQLTGTLDVSTNSKISATALSGSLTQLTDGTSYLIAGTNVTITTGSNGSVTIASTGGGGGGTGTGFNDGGNKLNTTSSVAFAGGLGSAYYVDSAGADVFFFVSGSTNSRGTATRGTAVIGGDAVTSGTLHVLSNLRVVNGAVITGSLTQGGVNAQANGSNSHAEGVGSVANAAGSHAEGYFTNAENLYSHAEGGSTKTYGVYAHAQGYNTVASGSQSFAGGYYTIASGSGQSVLGQYNKRGNDFSLFVIGDGTATDDASRSDILRVNSGSTGGTGRVEVTGTLAATIGLSGSLTKLTDGSPYLIAGSNVTITTGSNGAVTIASTGGGGGSGTGFNDGGNKLNTTSSVAFAGGLGSSYYADSLANNVQFFVSGSKTGFGVAGTKDAVFGGNAVVSGSLKVGTGLEVAEVASVVTYLDSKNFLNISANGGGVDINDNNLIRLLSTNGVRLGSTFFGVNVGNDTHTFISGAIGSRGTSTKGTTVIGGDAVLSGSTVAAGGISGSLTKLTDGTSYLIAGSNVTITTGSNGAVTIASTGGGGGSGDPNATYLVLSATGSLNNERVITAGTGISTTDAGAGGNYTISINDSVVATVSGTTFTGGVYLSDLFVSGNARLGNSPTDNLIVSSTSYFGRSIDVGAQNLGINSSEPVTGSLIVRGGPNAPAFFGAGNQTVHLIGTGTNGSGAGIIFGDYLGSQFACGIMEDVDDGLLIKSLERISLISNQAGVGINTTNPAFGYALHVSGAARVDTLLHVGGGDNTSDTNFGVSGSIGSKGTAVRGTATFGGDLVSSGVAYFERGLSGSLTKLTDGTSYLIAGNNVTITTGSSGAVTIASTGGGGGGDSFFTSTTQFSIFTTGSTAFVGTEAGIDSPQDKGADIFFYVSGSKSSKDGATPGVSMFGGDLMLSGSTYVASGSSILPVVDRGSDLGSASKRWGNVYTGDLHLRNDRGDWTIVEEEDYLCVVNNKTGKKFKMALIPLEE